MLELQQGWAGKKRKAETQITKARNVGVGRGRLGGRVSETDAEVGLDWELGGTSAVSLEVAQSSF